MKEKSVMYNGNTFRKVDIERIRTKDAWLHNKLLNEWESKNRVDVVTSYPLDMSIPFINGCDAKCVFCSYWGCEAKYISDEEIDLYSDIFRFLEFVGINPAGEALLHPRFDSIIPKIRSKIDDRCGFYLVTNGTHLHEKIPVVLENINTLTVSLNAATEKTHSRVLGVKGKFDRIIHAVKDLVERKKRWRFPIEIYMTYIVLGNNIHEIPEFIELAEKLEIDRIYFRNLATGNSNNPIKPSYNPDYCKLPPYLNPDFTEMRDRAVRAIESAGVDIVCEPDSWEKEIFIENEGEHAKRRKIPFVEAHTTGEAIGENAKDGWVEASDDLFPMKCQYLYKYMIDPRLSNIQPVCVYMETLPGYEPITFDLEEDFFKIRNAPAVVALRKALRDGKYIPEVCLKCNMLKAFKES